MKKRTRIISLAISFIMASGVSTALAIGLNSGDSYIKASAETINIKDDTTNFTKITYANLATELHEGDFVFFANTNSTTTSGVGEATNVIYPYKATTREDLIPFVITDIDGYNVAFQYSKNGKYIDIKTGNLDSGHINVDNMNYLKINGSDRFVIPDNEDYAFGVGHSYIGFFKANSPDSNNFYCYKINYTEDNLAYSINNSVICDNGVTSPNQHVWNNLSDFYTGFDSSTKTTLATMDGDEEGSDLEKAIAKYDYIIKKYYKTGDYSDFIGRIDTDKVVPDSVQVLLGSNSGNNYEVIVIISISVLTIIAITSFAILRKRRG